MTACLAARDHSCRVVTLARTGDAPAGVEVEELGHLPREAFRRLAAIRRTARSHRSDRQELRYATGPDDPIAHVTTFHSCAAWRLSELKRAARSDTRGLRGRLRPAYLWAYFQWSARLELRMVERARKSLTRITAVSEALASQLRAHYDPSLSVRVIPNGIDTAEFSPARTEKCRSRAREKYGVRDNQFVIGFLGGDWDRKNLGTFVRVINALCKEHRDVVALVAGHGAPAPFIEWYPGLVGDHLRFVGPTTEPAEFYRALDVYYSASAVESFGLPPLEAMACGVPTVISASVGLAEFLRNGETVLLPDALDVAAAVDALRRLKDDSRVRESLVSGGLGAATRLSWSHSAELLEAELAESSRHRS